MKKNIRADHVGSLLRPPELLDAREAFATGRLPLNALREKEESAILGVVQKQRELGLDIFTDGELRRGSWLTDMAEAVEGFVSDRVNMHWKGPQGGVRRIDAAARFIPLENLALSPQCGFASVAAGNPISMDDQWRKLHLVADTTRKVWGALPERS